MKKLTDKEQLALLIEMKSLQTEISKGTQEPEIQEKVIRHNEIKNKLYYGGLGIILDAAHHPGFLDTLISALQTLIEAENDLAKRKRHMTSTNETSLKSLTTNPKSGKTDKD